MGRVSKYLAPLLCLALFAQLVLASTTRKGEPMKTYVLTQRSAVLGDVITYVSPNAIKAVFVSNHAYLIAKAPDWRVVIYSPGLKTAVDLNFQDYLNHAPQFSFMGQDGGSLDFHRPLFRNGTKQYAEHTCSMFVYPVNESTRVFTTETPIFAYFFALEKSDVPKEATQILEKLFFQPPVPGIPLFDKLIKKPSSIKNKQMLDFEGDYSILSTSKIVEQKTLPNFYEYPSGFKRVAREIEVIADKARTHELEEISRDMKLGF